MSTNAVALNTDGVIADAAASQAADASNSSAAQAAERGYEAVKKGCGGGGCQKEITGQCCAYQSALNASCQKAMAPYSDSCGSCGGSGISDGGGGGGSGSGGGGSSSSAAATVAQAYDLEYIFSTAIIPFSEEPVPTLDPLPNFRGKLRFNKTAYADVTRIYISEIDRNGELATSVFAALQVGDPISVVKTSAPSEAYAVFNFVSQTTSVMEGWTYRTFEVTCNISRAAFTEGMIVSFGIPRVVAKVPVGSTQFTVCPACNGTGLADSTGGLEGLVMSVWNGSAGWAGTNIDIFGIG